MARILLYILVLISIFCTYSCKRYVCPAYSGTFLLGIGHTDQYFSYLYIDSTGEKSGGSSSFSSEGGTEGGDSIPKEFGIWASHPKKWNGLIKEKRPLHRLWWKLRYGWDVRMVRREKLRQNINIIYPKEILAEIAWLDSSGVMDSVVLDTTDVFDEGYVPDSLYYKQNADSLAKAKKKKDNFPEPKWDQFMYELGFGDLLKQDSIDEANRALGDTTLVKLVRTTWWKFWLPKYLEVTKEQYEEAMMRAAMDTIPDSATVARQQLKLAKKEEKEREKREKEEEKQKLEEEKQLREEQEQEEEGVDDW